MNYKEYYTAIGKLVYAIAKADGKIQTGESAKIFYFVISQIVDLEKESGNGRHALEAFNTEREFHRLEKQNASVQDAVDGFFEFLEENKTHCDDKLKNTCLNVMERVAMAYNEIEESEKELIDKIKEKIQEI
jgi:uncharacterized tellurite resistance protein B-like protein